MSGGVDSSVAALLLKQQGYHVIGLFMKNWEEKDANGVCQSTRDYEDVVRVCETLDIPYYGVNFVQEYWKSVFEPFISDLKQGLTPNPDLLCNREIKFQVFLDKALELGASKLATGHYCRIGMEGANPQLLRGKDPNKDQSYFLASINGNALNHVLFPIGDLMKSEVRELARTHGLATSEKRDSTGICFIGKRNFKEFVSQYVQTEPGEFITPEGEVVGRHDGAPFYTIGQRRGLGIGGAGDPWFVVDKDLSLNRVVVVQGENHPALYKEGLLANELNWISPNSLDTLPFACSCKVRYRQNDVSCIIESIENGVAKVKFANPERAITPRQAVVFYKGDVCLGSGIIV